MKSKKALLMIVPIFASISLVACGNQQTSSNPATSTPVAPITLPDDPTPGDIDVSSIVDSNGVIKEKVTISFWSITGASSRKALEGYISAFQKKQPNVTVDNQYISGGYSDLKTNIINGFSTNNYPNLAVAYPDHVADYLDYNKAVDLTQVYEDPIVGFSEDDKKDYISTFMDEGTNYAQEGIYSLPWCKSTELMYYDEKLIGLDLSAYDATINNGNALSATYLNSLTWDDLFEKICPAIEKYNAAHPEAPLYNASDDAAIVGYDSDDNLFITLAEQYGYGYTSVNKNTGKGSVDFDNPEMRALIEKFHNYAAKKYLTTKGLLGGSTYVNSLFNVNKCLFSIGSTGGVTYQFSDDRPINIGAARIPQADPKNGKTILQGPSITILNRNSDAQTVASWLLWKELTNKDNALDWALSTGYMGVRESVYESKKYLEKNDVADQDDASLDRLKANSNTAAATIVNETFTSPVFVGSAACRDAAGGLLTQCLVKTSWSLTGAALTTYIANQFKTASDNAKLELPE